MNRITEEHSKGDAAAFTMALEINRNEVHTELARAGRLNKLNRILGILWIPACLIILYLYLNDDLVSLLLWKPTKHYYIIIDAGSHGSRLFIFDWIPRVEHERQLHSPHITIPREIFSAEHSEGINNMKEHHPTETAPKCIASLIYKAVEFLNQRGIENMGVIPIHLKATAGMRNIDAVTRSRIMISIRDYLSNKTLSPFLFRRDWARVTAGEEEGVYGWITVNNGFKTLLEPPERTFGALDLGGSSMQITFFPKHTSVIEDYYGLLLGGKTVRLYSHSYLAYGWDDALSRVTTKLALNIVLDPSKSPQQTLKNSFNRTLDPKASIMGDINLENSTTVLKGFHPCFPADYKFTFTLPSLVYPEGRFYIDVDHKSLIRYMTNIGIPKEYHKAILLQKRDQRDNFFPMDTVQNYKTFDPIGIQGNFVDLLKRMTIFKLKMKIVS